MAITVQPTVQFDALVRKLVEQTSATPDDLDELMAHVYRMRMALVPFAAFAQQWAQAGGENIEIDYPDGKSVLTKADFRAAFEACDFERHYSS